MFGDRFQESNFLKVPAGADRYTGMHGSPHPAGELHKSNRKPSRLALVDQMEPCQSLAAQNMHNFEMNINQASLPCHPIPLRYNGGADDFNQDMMGQNSLLQIPI